MPLWSYRKRKLLREGWKLSNRGEQKDKKYCNKVLLDAKIRKYFEIKIA
jgi:hypothetical protein